MENDFKDLEKAFEALGEIMSGICTAIDEMADAMSRGFEKGFSNFDIDSAIAAVKADRSSNWFQKKRRIRELKKLKKEMEKREADND